VGCRYQHVRREEDVSYHPRGTDKGRRPSADVFLFVAHQVMKRTEVLFGQSDLRASERPPNVARHATRQTLAVLLDFHERALEGLGDLQPPRIEIAARTNLSLDYRSRKPLDG
jgi:hypothetical protein